MWCERWNHSRWLAFNCFKFLLLSFWLRWKYLLVGGGEDLVAGLYLAGRSWCACAWSKAHSKLKDLSDEHDLKQFS